MAEIFDHPCSGLVYNFSTVCFRIWRIEWCDRHFLSRDRNWPLAWLSACVRASRVVGFRLKGNLVVNISTKIGSTLKYHSLTSYVIMPCSLSLKTPCLSWFSLHTTNDHWRYSASAIFSPLGLVYFSARLPMSKAVLCVRLSLTLSHSWHTPKRFQDIEMYFASYDRVIFIVS